MKTLRIALGVVLLIISLIAAAQTQSPPSLALFAFVLVAPVAGLLIAGVRGAPLSFLTGAMYAAACALNGLYHPAGDTTFVEQFSTMGLVAMALPPIARLFLWIRKAVSPRTSL